MSLWVKLCPPERYVEILTPGPSECDLIWQWDLRRCSQVQMRSYEVRADSKPYEQAMRWQRLESRICRPSGIQEGAVDGFLPQAPKPCDFRPLTSGTGRGYVSGVSQPPSLLHSVRQP